MNRYRWGLWLWLALGSPTLMANSLIKGFNLTELGANYYDAAVEGAPKTPAQNVIDHLQRLGVNQITLNPRAVMKDPRGVEVIPLTEGSSRSQERQRYLRLIRYIKKMKMKVGIRPIFFVVDAQGRTPYVEHLPDGTTKEWWHGNIQPKDPNKWFESFQAYLDIYQTIARAGKVDEFTIGAELYSMTVGIEDQWLEHPHGFPGNWLRLLRYTRSRLAQTKIMYDINFTDATIRVHDNIEHGGEFARWKYRLSDPSVRDESNEHWQNLRNFWLGLDAIGIDMYRSLASKQENIPEDYDQLVSMLKVTSDRYAGQIDNGLFEISEAVGSSQPIMFKELGFCSVQNSFIDPFTYATRGSGQLNVAHQAAAYQAIFQSFFSPSPPYSWFQGAVFWDVSVDPTQHGPTDQGFSPIGKKLTEEVIKKG